MKRVMLDTNALRTLSQDDDCLSKFEECKKREIIQHITTHIQEDEIRLCPNEKQKRIAESIKSEMVPTRGFIVGLSGLGQNGGLLGAPKIVLGPDTKNKLRGYRDILIGGTALDKSDILVTDDRHFRKFKKFKSKLEIIDYKTFKVFLDNQLKKSE